MVLERLPFGIVLGTALCICFAGFCIVRRRRAEKRRVSFGDRLLFAAPAFLLLGFSVMCRERTEYNGYRAQFTECMESGRELLAKGVIRHIRMTENGVSFELERAEAASYSAKEEVYRPVGTLLVYTDDLAAKNGTLKDGQQVFLYGKGREIEPPGNPGQFDAEQYYFSIGITGTLTAATVRITDFSYHRFNQALFLAKCKLQKTYVTYLGENGAGVVSSMLLGERALLSDETKELYRHGGISHILAISGLHVSLLGMAVYQLLRRTVLGRNGAIPAACACVILYGRFVEAGTSTKRAVIMFFLLLLAAALGRTYDTLSAMSVSAVVILCQTPGALYTASFQLSYAAAYGASVLAVLLKEREREHSLKEKAVWTAKQADSKWVRLRVDITEQVKSTFLFGGAIQLVTLPVTVFHYFEYPLYGFFLNPLVVPLMTILLFCALLTGVCGCFSVWLGHFFAGGVGAILWVYEALCGIVSKLPFSLLLFGKPALWQIGIYFTVLAVCLYIRRGGRRGRKNRRGQKGIVCVLVLLPLCLLPLPCAAFEAAFLDVGQGDSIVLRERTGAVLTVDGGSADVQKVGEKRLAAYLKAKGIRVIDCAIISHGDSDHISGIRELLARMPVYSSYRASAAGYEGELFIKRIVLPIPAISDPACQALAKLAEEKNVEVCYLAAGDRLKAGEELVLSCLAPKEGAVYSDKNAASLVLLASYGEFDLLLTGDMDAAGERNLLEEGAVDGISVEVLKVAHHGSSSSSSEEFLAALKPAFSVISCGKGNRYGHPHKEVLKRLEEHGTEVYRTDECGAIEVRVKRNKAEILVHGGG